MYFILCLKIHMCILQVFTQVVIQFYAVYASLTWVSPVSKDLQFYAS